MFPSIWIVITLDMFWWRLQVCWTTTRREISWMHRADGSRWIYCSTTPETRFSNTACRFCTISVCLVDAGRCWLSLVVPETLENERLKRSSRRRGRWLKRSVCLLRRLQLINHHVGLCQAVRVLTIRGIQSEVEEDKTGSLITCKHGEPPAEQKHAVIVNILACWC